MVGAKSPCTGIRSRAPPLGMQAVRTALLAAVQGEARHTEHFLGLRGLGAALTLPAVLTLRRPPQSRP